MKKIILTKKQLLEYIQRKKDNKVFLNILRDFRKNAKYLNENISLKNANQSIIDLYFNRNLINDNVKKMLIESKIINNNNKIL